MKVVQGRQQAEDEQSEAPQGFRAMLKRHQESRASHIDRIRRNMPTSSSPRSMMPIAGSEEVMRLKNELAIQRALRL